MSNTSRANQKARWPVFRPTTTIIVPVLNEADNVLPLVKRVKKAVSRRNVEILFVDDSKDTKTVQKVKIARAKYRSKTFDARIFRRKGEECWGGLAGAVADGINRAKGEQVIVMDGDLQHPPEIISDMLAASSNADIVVASRYVDGGSADGLSGGVRRLVSRASTILAKAFFPLRLHNVNDPMTGFFLVNRNKVNRNKLCPRGFKILLEILVTHHKLSVVEVPMQFEKRVAGESHGSAKQGLEFLYQLLVLRFNQRITALSRIPKTLLFGIIGGSVFVVGMVLLSVLVEFFGWPPIVANAVQLAVTFWLNYLLNRQITWRERTVSRLAAHKFLLSRGATTLINYLLFILLVSQQFFSVHYIAANVITLLAVTVLNYLISDRWVFAEPKPKTKVAVRSWYRVPTIAYLGFLLFAVLNFSLGYDTALTISVLLVIASLVLFVQSSIEAWRMSYAYRDPDSVDRLRFPTPLKAKEKFCIIVPARHESTVLAGTLIQLAKQTHPDVKIITVICDDDHETLRVGYNVEFIEPKVKVFQYPLEENSKPSKPKQLNYVLSQIKDDDYSVIGVIDAEDTVHPELLMHIDRAFRDRKTGIVQGGVQLMNHDTSWYSLHNVLEYYRWFNSAMAFQADYKFMPLGGNTVFIREKLLRKAGGWPETLTEDCSLGVLLSTRLKAKTAVYYEPRLATQEETPDSLKNLFKQRVRWNQGFFHEWRKGVWKELPGFRQRFLADYVLLSPIILGAIVIMMPISILAVLFLNSSISLVMLMYLPLIPATLHLVFNAVFLHDFGKAFQRKILIRHYVILLTTQIFYQLILSAAAFWAIIRELRGEDSWHKTPHLGTHRYDPAYAAADLQTSNFRAERADA